MIVRVSIIVSASPFMISLIPFILLALFLIQHFHLRQVRHLHRLKLETSLSLYSRFTETIAGLTHIRALKWQDAQTARNWSLIDESQKISLCILQEDNYVKSTLDILTTVVITSFVALVIHSKVPPFAAGLVMILLHRIRTDDIPFTMEEWEELDHSMHSLDRIQSFARNTPRMAQNGHMMPIATWPSTGVVEFRNVSIR